MLDKLFKIVVVCFMSWILAGCNSEGQPWTNDEQSEVNIYFRLSIDGEPVTNSRGLLPVSVHIYDAATTQFIARIEELMCYPINSEETIFQFIGRIPNGKLQVDKLYKFMFFVNCEQPIPENEQLETMIFDGTSVQKDIDCPMWGVCQYTLVADTDGALKTSYDLGIVDLLRAVAKVHIALSDKVAEDYLLTGAKINYANPTGYVLPTSWKSVTKTKELWADNLLPKDFFRPLTAKTPLPCSFVSEVAGKQLAVYLPEYDNLTSKEAVVDVSVQDKQTKEKFTFQGNIKFREYTNGTVDPTSTPQDIMRNHLYEFTIAKITIGSPLTVTTQVSPWEVKEDHLKYSENISVTQTLKWEKGTYSNADPESEGVVDFIYGKKLSCSFKIDTPEGSKWYAFFHPIDGNPDAFMFVTDEHPEGVSTLTGELGKMAKLSILPKASSITRTNKAYLRIVVRTPDNKTLEVPSLMPEGLQARKGFIIIQSI